MIIKTNKLIMTSRIVLFLSIIFMLSSCKAKHDLAYFEDIKDIQSGILKTPEYTTLLEAENELIITVTSTVPAASAMFNLPYTNVSTSGTTALSTVPNVKTYMVDNKGNIDFPVLGTIHVAGMTVYELKEYLERRISEHVKDAIVSVSMQGYKITVLGEVAKPQTIYTAADRYSILNALGDCGDLTEYGKRDNILVMRRTADNQIEYGRIDLHNSNMTQSPYFWLKHNDVVVVEPNKVKQENSKYNQYTGYKLSVISTIVGAASVVASVIALTVK